MSGYIYDVNRKFDPAMYYCGITYSISTVLLATLPFVIRAFPVSAPTGMSRALNTYNKNTGDDATNAPLRRV